MISTFVVRCLDSIVPRISRPKLVSVAEQAGLSLNWSHTPKTGFFWRGSYMCRRMTKQTKWPVRTVKTQISLWHLRSKGSRGPKRMPRLIWVFAWVHMSFCCALAHMYNKLPLAQDSLLKDNHSPGSKTLGQADIYEQISDAVYTDYVIYFIMRKN